MIAIVTEVEDHEHFISSMLFEISFVLFTISVVLFTMSLVLIAISSVFFSIPSVVFASSSMVFATSPILLAMATFALAESGWTTIRREVGNLMGGFLTFFVLHSRLVCLRYDHPDLLVYQII